MYNQGRKTENIYILRKKKTMNFYHSAIPAIYHCFYLYFLYFKYTHTKDIIYDVNLSIASNSYADCANAAVKAAISRSISNSANSI